MSHAPYDLVLLVFETLGLDEHWAQGGYEDGHFVNGVSTPLDYMVVHGHFVLPRLSQVQPGRYPVLTVSRGRPSAGSGVFLHLCYEPFAERFLVAADVACPGGDMQVLELEGAGAASTTGRVLRAVVLIARTGVFPSIVDVATGDLELSGELALTRSSRQPWGKSAEGTWWITSGAESELDDEERSFPKGFGLSDLRVTVFDQEEDGDSGSVAYSGALDHLVGEAGPEGDDALVAAVNKLFRAGLADAEPSGGVLEMITGLIRRLRLTLDKMVQAEVELIAASKERFAFRKRRDLLLAQLRVVFDQARLECRNHFTRDKADEAGFPARIADDPGALLRQTKVTSWTLRRPDFDLGQAVIPNSTVTAESILEIYEPKAEELATALAGSVRRQARTRRKQVAKDQEVADFRATYSVFVGILRGAFRLVGEPEIANRLTLNQIGGTTASPTQPEEEPEPAQPPGDETEPGEPASSEGDQEPGESGG